VLDVFRFAWFALRTFAGFVLLVLTLYAALWAFVKIDSMATRNVDHHAALRLVKVADHRNEVRRSRVEHDRGLGRARIEVYSASNWVTSRSSSSMKSKYRGRSARQFDSVCGRGIQNRKPRSHLLISEVLGKMQSDGRLLRRWPFKVLSQVDPVRRYAADVRALAIVCQSSSVILSGASEDCCTR